MPSLTSILLRPKACLVNGDVAVKGPAQERLHTGNAGLEGPLPHPTRHVLARRGIKLRPQVVAGRVVVSVRLQVVLQAAQERLRLRLRLQQDLASAISTTPSQGTASAGTFHE